MTKSQKLLLLGQANPSSQREIASSASCGRFNRKLWAFLCQRFSIASKIGRQRLLEEWNFYTRWSSTILCSSRSRKDFVAMILGLLFGLFCLPKKFVTWFWALSHNLYVLFLSTFMLSSDFVSEFDFAVILWCLNVVHSVQILNKSDFLESFQFGLIH